MPSISGTETTTKVHSPKQKRKSQPYCLKNRKLYRKTQDQPLITALTTPHFCIYHGPNTLTRRKIESEEYYTAPTEQATIQCTNCFRRGCLECLCLFVAKVKSKPRTRSYFQQSNVWYQTIEKFVHSQGNNFITPSDFKGSCC